MKILEMAMGMKRSVRLKPYVIIGPEFWMKVEVGPDEDVDVVLAELKEDVIATLDDLEAEEAVKLGFHWNPESESYEEVSE